MAGSRTWLALRALRAGAQSASPPVPRGLESGLGWEGPLHIDEVAGPRAPPNVRDPAGQTVTRARVQKAGHGGCPFAPHRPAPHPLPRGRPGLGPGLAGPRRDPGPIASWALPRVRGRARSLPAPRVTLASRAEPPTRRRPVVMATPWHPGRRGSRNRQSSLGTELGARGRVSCAAGTSSRPCTWPGRRPGPVRGAEPGCRIWEGARCVCVCGVGGRPAQVCRDCGRTASAPEQARLRKPRPAFCPPSPGAIPDSSAFSGLGRSGRWSKT